MMKKMISMKNIVRSGVLPSFDTQSYSSEGEPFGI